MKQVVLLFILAFCPGVFAQDNAALREDIAKSLETIRLGLEHCRLHYTGKSEAGVDYVSYQDHLKQLETARGIARPPGADGPFVAIHAGITEAYDGVKFRVIEVQSRTDGKVTKGPSAPVEIVHDGVYYYSFQPDRNTGQISSKLDLHFPQLRHVIAYVRDPMEYGYSLTPTDRKPLDLVLRDVSNTLTLSADGEEAILEIYRRSTEVRPPDVEKITAVFSAQAPYRLLRLTSSMAKPLGDGKYQVSEPLTELEYSDYQSAEGTGDSLIVPHRIVARGFHFAPETLTPAAIAGTVDFWATPLRHLHSSTWTLEIKLAEGAKAIPPGYFERPFLPDTQVRDATKQKEQRSAIPPARD